MSGEIRRVGGERGRIVGSWGRFRMVELGEKGPLVGYGRTSDIFRWGQYQVVKLYHENWPLEVVEEEARVSRLVREIGLPVPDVSGTVED